MTNTVATKALSRLALTIFQGRAGDHNPRAMAGTALLGQALAQRTGASPLLLGHPDTPLNARWDRELDAARPALLELAATYDRLLTAQCTPLTVMGRCACALATLPAVAHHRSDACIVWFDAHADSNTPSNTMTGYLGGLVLTGAAGLWDTGLGSGLEFSNVILVGARDIDPPEQELIDAGTLRLVTPGSDLAASLHTAIGERAVYIHIDCDVLEPGIVPTDYRVEGGLSLEDLHAACETLARNEIVGLEVAEFEATWQETGMAASTAEICDALQPLIDAMSRRQDDYRFGA
jgi:arginase